VYAWTWIIFLSLLLAGWAVSVALRRAIEAREIPDRETSPSTTSSANTTASFHTARAWITQRRWDDSGVSQVASGIAAPSVPQVAEKRESVPLAELKAALEQGDENRITKFL